MQNCYIGDIGDFGKFLLLKNICKDELRLGVNWCLSQDEIERNDGNKTGYLQKDSKIYVKADAILFQQLKKIVFSSDRTIERIKQDGIFDASTLFFSDKIPSGTKRFVWHDTSLNQLSESDIIFYDPDNGLEINSCGKLHPKSVKYIYFNEIRDAYQERKSIIIYQHSNRNNSTETQIETRIKQLIDCLKISISNIRIVYSGRGTGRYYIIIKQARHSNMIDQNLIHIKNTAVQILKVHDIYKEMGKEFPG